MRKVKILWADDEIDLLKPHILFLNEKGYEVETGISGDEAIDKLKSDFFDIVFLDENMPGLSGLETLDILKKIEPNIPVVMITKSEEEHLMDEAIGSKIADYLIKPVNPKQILLTIKKNLDLSRLVTEKVTSTYQRDFREIGMTLSDRLDFEEWKDVYNKIVGHELKLSESSDRGMDEILAMQKSEANQSFGKFIENNYLNWLNGVEEAPVMSHTLMKKKVIPEIEEGTSTFFILIDCLRFDQWKVIYNQINKLFHVEEDLYCAILPTATQYARNAIFSGLMPSEIQKKYADKWSYDEDDGGKNNDEAFFMEECLRRHGKNVKTSYTKVVNLEGGKRLVEKTNDLFQNPFNVIVYNFVDALSHARTDTKIVRELVEDEKAYRSVTASWFEHSPLWECMKKIAQKGGKVVLSTDHGSVRVHNASKVVGDRNVNSNLRYKQGKALQYKGKDVFAVEKPEEAFLPKQNISDTYIFAKNDNFFAYPNNYNHYVNYYQNTFQHGGISLEEMMIPIVSLTPKS